VSNNVKSHTAYWYA